jgi:hypothetical protein
MTIQEAARLAITVQDACNLSGVLRSFHEIVSEVLWPEARKQGKGTEFVNTHPIVTLFLDKLASLNRGALTCDYQYAYSECERIAREEVQS